MTIASIACKKCENDLWEERYGDDLLHCTNCTETRPYIRRQKRDDIVTPSQERKLAAIKRYFDGSQFSLDGEPSKEITKLETHLQEGTGLYYISIETGSNSIWSLEGGYFAIGRRGGLRVLSVYRVTDDKKALQTHIAKILGGKVRW